jgi:ABC-type amino acid transport substrate-binding protein
MRRLAVCSLLGAVGLASGGVALACGDKLLALGRGVRFQRVYAVREANLLIYAAGTRGGVTLGSTKLQTTLGRAVHKVQVVQGGAQLDEALKSGKVDVVLVDFADLAAITGQLQSAPARPAILPVLLKPSRAEFAAVQKTYKFAVKAPAEEFDYLAAIDEAMKLRLKASGKS